MRANKCINGIIAHLLFPSPNGGGGGGGGENIVYVCDGGGCLPICFAFPSIQILTRRLMAEKERERKCRRPTLPFSLKTAARARIASAEKWSWKEKQRCYRKGTKWRAAEMETATVFPGPAASLRNSH